MANNITPGKSEASRETRSNRVFQTICILQPIEHKKLLKFLKSPYFNQSKTLTELCAVLIAISAKGEEGFIKEKVWAKVFPGKPFNDINFRKACSDLLELMETFMATEVFINDQFRLSIDKIEYVVSQKIEPLYRTVVAENEKLSAGKSYFTQMDYYYNYLFEKKYHKLMNFDVKMNQKLNIEKISDNLDIFYLIDKLKAICNGLVQSKISSVEYDLNEVASILSLCKKFDLDKHAELATYYYRLFTLTDGDNFEHYYKLKNVLEQNAHQIPQSEAIEIFETTLNYCIGRANKGDKNFLPEYFELFLKAIQQKVFVVNGELATWRFNNIVVVGLRLGKLDWADQFVEKNKDLLSENIRANIVKFNLARINLYKKDYEKVLDHVRDVEYEDIIINLTSKIMTSIAYYELDEYETLDSFIEAFRTFINRQKDIQTGLKQSHLLFLGFERKLMRTSPGDKKAIEKLREDILAAKPNPVNKEWLLEKLEELQ
jgi:hypothetical protein